MATMTDAGLDLIAQWILGIAPPEPLALVPYDAPAPPSPSNVFSDFTATPLPGGSPVSLNPTSWSDGSVPGLGDYTYPLIQFTFTTSMHGDTLIGYMVYSVMTNTVLWYDVFEFPRVIPPTGGVLYLNLEFTDLNRT